VLITSQLNPIQSILILFSFFISDSVSKKEFPSGVSNIFLRNLQIELGSEAHAQKP
jgi:hypothetical protein